MTNDPTPRRPVYADYHATTPLDPRVLNVMLPFLTSMFGNAASTDHIYGAEAATAVQRAREQLASLINARPDEIVFTSGATESNNLAIRGTAERSRRRGQHIITVATEHKAVLDTCAHLQSLGWHVSYLPVDRDGFVDLDALRATISKETVLISVMTANNEVGTIAPIEKIGQIAKEHDVVFHTDAAQAAAYEQLDVQRANVDLMSLSAHKMYGPKGVGALYVRKQGRRIHLEPIMHGGGHERGLRSGTLNVPGIVGMGVAAAICRQSLPADRKRIAELRDELWAVLRAGIPNIRANGAIEARLPNNLSVTIPGIESRSLLIAIRADVAISAGSACTTTKVEPSHVLSAMGRTDDEAHETIRISLGRFTTEDELRFIAQCLTDAVTELRQWSRTA